MYLPQTPLPSRLLHNIEQSSLCYTVGPCWLSILNTRRDIKSIFRMDGKEEQPWKDVSFEAIALIHKNHSFKLISIFSLPKSPATDDLHPHSISFIFSTNTAPFSEHQEIEMVTMNHFLHASLLCYRHLFLELKDQKTNHGLLLLFFDLAHACLREQLSSDLCIEPLSCTRHCTCSIQRQSPNQCLKIAQR